MDSSDIKCMERDYLNIVSSEVWVISKSHTKYFYNNMNVNELNRIESCIWFLYEGITFLTFTLLTFKFETVSIMLPHSKQALSWDS